MNKIGIEKTDSEAVEKLFYGYNALIDLLSGMSTKTELYADLLQDAKHEKYLLESEKDRVIHKYFKDTLPSHYTFNFFDSTIDYE